MTEWQGYLGSTAKKAAPPPSGAPSADPNTFVRARAYVAKMPSAISGQGGHQATWNVARKCAADFGLSEGDTLELLREYNQRCEPRWSDRELAHKAHDAATKVHTSKSMNDERHWRMPREQYRPGNGATPPGEDWNPTDDDAPDAPPSGERPDEPSWQQPTQGDPLRGLNHLSAVAVLGKDAILTLAREPVEYAWQDIAVMATVILIAGPPSGGKTTLLFLLLAARLSSTPVRLLGRDVQPSNPKQYMVLIEGEHSEPSAARKLVRSLELLDVSTDGLERVIIVARKAVRLGSPEWIDVERMVQQGLVSDIAIDTVARVAPADGSSEQEQVAIFDAVARTIEFGPDDHKPLVWAVSHVRKNGQNGDVEDVSGSTQRTGQADSVLLIKPEKQGGRTISTTVTFVKLREDPEDRWPEPATFSIVTEGGKRVLKQDNASTTEPTDERPLEERILEQLATGPKTKGALKTALKRSDKDVDGALTSLFTSRSIRTAYVTVRGMERKAFELAPEWRQDP